MSPTVRVGHFVVLIALAASLAAVGRWGRRQELGSAALRDLPDTLRESRLVVIRRGGLACELAAAVLAVVAVGALA